MSTQSIERPPLNDLTNVEAWRLLNHAQTRRDDAKRDRDGWARAIADSIARGEHLPETIRDTYLVARAAAIEGRENWLDVRNLLGLEPL